jgi:hypothetical protein
MKIRSPAIELLHADRQLGEANYPHLCNFAVNVTENNVSNVGFEVFTPVVMKSIIFWDMTSSFNHLLACWFLLNLFFRP